jgi:hypothetical protein
MPKIMFLILNCHINVCILCPLFGIDLIFYALMIVKNHLESVSHKHSDRDCKLYIIISFLILNHFERFFRNKKY